MLSRNHSSSCDGKSVTDAYRAVARSAAIDAGPSTVT
jgi:hypothetical protein